jgi:hypothetical protein
MVRFALALMVPLVSGISEAVADYRITEDFGGVLESYKVKYAALRASGERVIIDGVCNSACTLVLGIVPLGRICVTPRASLGFHMPFYDLAATEGIVVPSYEGAADLMEHYPKALREWLSRHGGLTSETKKLKSGPDLWAIVNPCPQKSF